MSSIACAACGAIRPGHDIVHFGSSEEGYRELCTGCFNTAMAARDGLEEFENIRLEPVGIDDCEGAIHEFHFRTRLLGDIQSLEAFELQDGEPAGYRFQLIGDAEEELYGLLGRLTERARFAILA